MKIKFVFVCVDLESYHLREREEDAQIIRRKKHVRADKVYKKIHKIIK